MMDRVEAEIMVSEVMYHPRPISNLEPEEAETGEFIELLNTGSQTVDLSGFHFDRGITYRFPDGTRIQPGEFLVIARNPVALISESPLSDALGPYLGSLSNSSETIRLNTALDQPLFSFRYQSKGHWPASPDGLSKRATSIWPFSSVASMTYVTVVAGWLTCNVRLPARGTPSTA